MRGVRAIECSCCAALELALNDIASRHRTTIGQSRCAIESGIQGVYDSTSDDEAARDDQRMYVAEAFRFGV